MRIGEQNQPVMMVCENLENPPACSLPAGYSWRWFKPGDQKTWLEIQSAAEPFRKIHPQLFAEQFGNNESIIARRMLFVLDKNKRPIATGTAWFDDYFSDEKYGRIHWLAVIPEEQNRGLGKAMMTFLCQKLLDLGCAKAYLRTSAARPAAIHLYLKSGFVPFIREAGEQKCWNEILAKKCK